MVRLNVGLNLKKKVLENFLFGFKTKSLGL